MADGTTNPFGDGKGGAAGDAGDAGNGAAPDPDRQPVASPDADLSGSRQDGEKMKGLDMGPCCCGAGCIHERAGSNMK